MFEKYQKRLEQLIRAGIKSAGDTPTSLRRVIFERGKTQAMGKDLPDSQPSPELVDFADKIAYMPYEVHDSDLSSLATEGYSDDAILEIINAASLAAGVGRLEIVKAAMRGERRAS